MDARREFHRPEGALLAGVFAELARRLGWNVWALRVLGLFGLYLEPLIAGGVYLLAALCTGLLLTRKETGEEDASVHLSSESLRERGRRIRELEEKFRALDRDGR